MAEGEKVKSTVLKESEIFGAKLVKDIEFLTKPEAVRWLKCRGCRNLSVLSLNDLKNK